MKDDVRRMLEEGGIEEGDRVEVVGMMRRLTYEGEVSEEVKVEGILLPSTELNAPGNVVVKLKNGYNVSIKPTKVRLLEKGRGFKRAEVEGGEAGEGERVIILGTGGTIASFVEYSTGAVYPAITPSDFLRAYPELSRIARIEPKILFSILSEEITPAHWRRMAEAVKEALEGGARGVVVAHGTDTMAYSSAALSFMLDGLPGPVVFVGSQRSSDRPSTDAALNVLSAVRLAASGRPGEVVAVMHGSTSDTFCLIHRGVRMRKMHTSRRDAFMSVSEPPLGIITGERIQLREDATPPGEGGVVVRTEMEEAVQLLQATPTLTPQVLDRVLEVSKGVVIAGTGLGHMRGELTERVKYWVEEGRAVVVASQCIFGRVNLNVYRTGRKLLEAGVIPASDMPPEVAYVKLMWVLGQTSDPEEVRGMMMRNLRGEISESSSPAGFGEEYYRWVERMGGGADG